VLKSKNIIITIIMSHMPMIIRTALDPGILGKVVLPYPLSSRKQQFTYSVSNKDGTNRIN